MISGVIRKGSYYQVLDQNDKKTKEVHASSVGEFRNTAGDAMTFLKDGQVKTLTVKSHLGGNLRLRTATPLTRNWGGAWQAAHGDNPTPFYSTPAIPAPLISDKALLNPPAVRPVLEYDLPTQAGKEYVFHLAR
jgi:alpha-L-fucosidase 2